MRAFFRIIGLEYRSIFKDEGALLVLVGALVIYSALYGFIYAPEVVTEMPIAVVDRDNTPSSRSLINMFDATKQVSVGYDVQTLDQGRALFYEHKVLGVILIPEGFEQQTLSGKQSHVSIYADGSYFLLYSSMLTAAANVVIERGQEVQLANFAAMGVDLHQAQLLSKPVEYKVEMLHNPYGGYATALLPAVLIVILQQVILIGIGMVMGTRNEFRKWGQYEGMANFKILMGQFISYFVMYVPLVIYLLWVNYKFFGYPMNGTLMDEVLFLVPYMSSVIFAGIWFGGMMRRRESSIMYLAVFSVFFIMVSGISWPKEGMVGVLYYLGKILPSSSGIEGWVSLRTAGNGLVDVGMQWVTLWVLTLIYGTMAYFSVRTARNLK